VDTATVDSAQEEGPPLALEVPAGRPSLDLHGEATAPLTLARQVWRGRELLLMLARKEFHVRYRRATLGILWALALPLLQALVLAVVFSRVARVHEADHYGAYVLIGMVAWSFFSMTYGMAGTAIVDGTDLSSRVYFPRVLQPLAQVGSMLYGYVVTLVISVALCPVLGAPLGVRLLWLVPATALLLAVTLGFVLVTCALHVYARDLRYVISAMLMVWLYVTPVVYPVSDVPGLLRRVVDVNPLTGVVDLFHAAVLSHPGGLLVPAAVALAWAAGLLVLGVALHCRFDRVFADLL